MADPWSHWRLRCTTDNCEYAAHITVVDDPHRTANSAEWRVMLREHADQAHRTVKHPTGVIVNVEHAPAYAEIIL